MTRPTVQTQLTVNGIPFGCTEGELTHRLGNPDKRAQNYTGEIELLYDTTIYRCLGDRFVECTLPDDGHWIFEFEADGVLKLWLEFEFANNKFFVDNALGDYRFYVEDPKCDEDILLELASHLRSLLEKRGDQVLG